MLLPCFKASARLHKQWQSLRQHGLPKIPVIVGGNNSCLSSGLNRQSGYLLQHTMPVIQCPTCAGTVRNLLVTANEINAAQEYLEKQDFWSGLSSDRRGRLKMQQPYFHRLNAVRNQRIAIDDCLAMARALFGDDVEQALHTLNQQFQLVNIAIDMYDDAMNDGGFQQNMRTKISWAVESDGVNEMNNVITAQIKIIEARLFPILRLDIK